MAERLSDPRAGLAAASAFAFNPIAIFISSYHCSTDSAYAFFLLLCAVLIMDRRYFLAGLTLGAAINTKLILLILIPPAFSFCRSRRDIAKLTGGLSLAVLPFIPLLFHPQLRAHNLLQYASNEDRWRFMGFLLELSDSRSGNVVAPTLRRLFTDYGRYGIMLLVFVLSALSFRLRCWSAPRLFLSVAAIFLIFTPGFGLQYLVLPIPLMAAIDAPAAWAYGISGGLMAVVSYGLAWRLQFSLESLLGGRQQRAAAIFGCIAWACSSGWQPN